MTLSVTELQPVLHDLFTDTATDLAHATGFCQRRRKLTGPAFAQALVFALLENPDATLDDYADFAHRHLGLEVTANAFDERFARPAARFLLALFLEAFKRRLDSARPALLPVLRRFQGVVLRDATTVGLPAALADLCPGRPGRGDGPAAAVKVVLEVEVTTGQFTEVSVLPGTANDKTAAVAAKPLPAGSLLLEDMGFLAGDRLQSYADQGVYVLTRVPAWTAFFARQGRGYRRLDLLKWLRGLDGDRAERPVFVFHQQKVPLRLIAVRVPEAEAQRRRQRARAAARQRGRAVSQRKLDLCDWAILVTNAPAGLVAAHEAVALRRVRWQVELVFKAFKSEGGLGRARSADPWRVLAEVFAKLLAMVVQQWVLLAAGYVMLVHSARRASRRVRRVAGSLVRALGDAAELAREVARLAAVLRKYGVVGRRRHRPSTLGLLAALDPDLPQREVAA
jgi:hypothetical protein